MQDSYDLPKDFWHPQKFDWAEEVEDDILKNEAATVPLLLRDHFDWAEEVEDDILKKEAATAPLLPRGHFDWAEDNEQEILMNKASMPSLSTGCFSEETTSADEISESSSENTVPLSLERTSPSWEYLQEEVNNEFRSRYEYTHYIGNPHHFNWMGNAVMEHSSTRPEESLAVMLAKPKIPRLLPESPEDDDWVDRIAAIVCNAFKFIDPVLLVLDEVDESMLRLRGSALQQAAKGHVLKYYTGHGWWMVDDNEAMEDYSLDVGDVGFYLEPNVMIGNGFVDAGGLPTREEWQSASKGMIDKANAKRKRKGYRKRHWKPKPSGLRQVTTIVPDDSTPSIMPILQPPSESGSSIDCRSAIVHNCDESGTSSPTTLPSSCSSELGSPDECRPSIERDCDESGTSSPTNLPSSHCSEWRSLIDFQPIEYQPTIACHFEESRTPTPTTPTTPTSSYSSELGSPNDCRPAIAHDCDESRTPTPTISPYSLGSPNECRSAIAHDCDVSKTPTPTISPYAGLPKAPCSLSGPPMDRKPAIVHGCDYQKKPGQSSQPAVRRKFNPPPQLRSPGASKSTATPTPKGVGRVHNNAPSRDPAIYYSFPPAQPRGSELKRFFKKAGRILLSGLRMPTQPLYSPNCFDVPMS